MRLFFLTCLTLFGAACTGGDLDLLVPDDAKIAAPQGTADSDTPPPAFTLPREYAQLLPFHVRIKKLSAVSGLASNDPAFDAVWRNRYALGDHNYGQGIGADLTWSAAKMSTWVKSVKPVCASQAIQSRFPALPEDVNELTLAAYGREVNQDDLELIDAAVAPSTSPEQRYEAICLAVLSSMEFVGR